MCTRDGSRQQQESRGSIATGPEAQRNSPPPSPSDSDRDRGEPVASSFSLLAPRATLFLQLFHPSTHRLTNSSLPVCLSRLAWREKSSQSREQLDSREGRGKGEAWEGRQAPSALEGEPASQPPPPHRGCRTRSKSLHLDQASSSRSRRHPGPPRSGDPSPRAWFLPSLVRKPFLA